MDTRGRVPNYPLYITIIYESREIWYKKKQWHKSIWKPSESFDLSKKQKPTTPFGKRVCGQWKNYFGENSTSDRRTDRSGGGGGKCVSYDVIIQLKEKNGDSSPKYGDVPRSPGRRHATTITSVLPVKIIADSVNLFSVILQKSFYKPLSRSVFLLPSTRKHITFFSKS